MVSKSATANIREHIGANQPDHIDQIRARLTQDYANIATTTTALLARARELPKEIDGKQSLDKYTDAIKDIRSAAQHITATRKAEKDPFKRGGEAVDAFFQDFVGRLEAAMTVLQQRQGGYLRAQEEAARRKALDEAARLECEAEEARKRAEASSRPSTIEKHSVAASTAQAGADAAAERAEASPADLIRTGRTARGGMATLTRQWKGEIEDAAAIPLELLRPYLSPEAIERAVNAAVRAGVREIPGVRIYEDARSQVR